MIIKDTTCILFMIEVIIQVSLKRERGLLPFPYTKKSEKKLDIEARQ